MNRCLLITKLKILKNLSKLRMMYNIKFSESQYLSCCMSFWRLKVVFLLSSICCSLDYSILTWLIIKFCRATQVTIYRIHASSSSTVEICRTWERLCTGPAELFLAPANFRLWCRQFLWKMPERSPYGRGHNLLNFSVPIEMKVSAIENPLNLKQFSSNSSTDV